MDAPHLVALVRAGATFTNDILVERDAEGAAESAGRGTSRDPPTHES